MPIAYCNSINELQTISENFESYYNIDSVYPQTDSNSNKEPSRINFGMIIDAAKQEPHTSSLSWKSNVSDSPLAEEIASNETTDNQERNYEVNTAQVNSDLKSLKNRRN